MGKGEGQTRPRGAKRPLKKIKQNDYIKGKVKATSNEDLVKAVNYVCDNGLIGSYTGSLTPATSTSFSDVYNNAKKILKAPDYTESSNAFSSYATVKSDASYWTFYVVGGNRTDAWIASELGKMMNDMTLLDGEECAYNVSIVKGVCANDNSVSSSKYDTSTVIGVVVEVDYLK